MDSLSLLARANRVAREYGATLLDDEGSGHFAHDTVRGENLMVEEWVIVTITDKHWLIPWLVVESRLRELVLRFSLLPYSSH